MQVTFNLKQFQPDVKGNGTEGLGDYCASRNTLSILSVSFSRTISHDFLKKIKVIHFPYPQSTHCSKDVVYMLNLVYAINFSLSSFLQLKELSLCMK